jgi:major membrane immunogen (membrane-anchored lipoprotein)
MKNTFITVVMAAAVLIAGCGKKSSSSSAPPPPAQAEAASLPSPVLQPALAAWQHGDSAAAVSSFIAADWSARPLFAAGSALNLSEDQFRALSSADRQAKSSEMTAQLDSFKQLAATVTQAGRDAASKGDAAQARKYFTSLKQCGKALDGPDCSSLVQLVGQSLQNRADTELLKIGQ